MVKSKEKRKHRWWIPVIITAAVLVAELGIYKTKNSRTDADLILTISGQGFEGHFYDAGERDKAVITFSGSEGGSSASDTMAWYYKQHGISSLGVTLFAGKDTGKNLDRVPLEYVENAITWLKEQGFENIAVDGISKGFRPSNGAGRSMPGRTVRPGRSRFRHLPGSSFCLLYIHARLGTSNWSSTTWKNFRTSPWFLDGCDDASDRSYCDIYAKIDSESI